MSIGIIVIAVVAVGLTAISANGRTPETRSRTRRDRQLQARTSLASVEPLLSCYGKPGSESHGHGFGRGNLSGRPATGCGGVQGGGETTAE